MDARAYMAERIPAIDRALDGRLPPADEAPTSLHAAMRHLLLPGGKRLRPVLALAGAEAAGGRPEDALPVAVAVELIHGYSLVHDDLPCMDDDDERRGQPTVHTLYGEAVAVLAGDALQALAFEAAAEARRPERVVALLARTAGSRALVGGQVDDLASGEAALDAAGIESIHLRKSAALIAASIAGGALAAGAEDGDVAVLEGFGRRIGVAFQIADDLLDADEDEGCSLVPVLGAGPARARAEALLDEGLAMIEHWGERAEPLRALARFAVWRDE